MAVLDQQRNQRGIQTLGTEFRDLVAAGHGYMVSHTNGNTYCIFARNYLNAVQERRLYISYTSDNGISWSTPVQLTSGNWDDDPCALQLDTGSTSSDIGIVFVRATSPLTTTTQILTRIGVEISGLTVNTPVDPITGSPSGFKYPSLLKTAAGYAIFAISASYATSASVSKWLNTSFTTNNWSLTTIANFWGGSTLNPFSLSVKKLSTGDFAAISVVRTALNGTAGGGMGNYTRAMVRLDVYTSFSNDEGATWSTPQNLTGYSGSPDLDLQGLTVAFDADLAELSDGTVVVSYTEGKTPQTISDTTTLAMPSNAGNVVCAVYHPVHNMLLLGTDDNTNGGLWVFDLTNQTRTRLHSGSTPALWGNVIQDIDISADGKYVAVGHSTGLEIIDTTSATIASWTITPIRTTTTPASLVADMQFVRFDTTGYTLYVVYGAGSTTNVWGFLVDASNPVALTNLLASVGGNIVVAGFVVTPTALVGFSSNRMVKTNKTSGVSLYTTTLSGSTSINAIQYDDLNDEFVVAGQNVAGTSGLHTLTDSGAAFAFDQSFGTATNPTAPSSIDSRTVKVVPGVGVYYSSGATGAGSEGMYVFGLKKPVGYITHHGSDQSIGENQYPPDMDGMRVIKDAEWRFSSDSFHTLLLSLTHTGRLRYGFFPYNSGTLQLTTAGVDFYDVVNTNRVSAYNFLQKPRFSVDLFDNLLFYARKYDVTDPSYPFSAYNGHVEPDTYKLFMRARIQATSLRDLQMRARIRVQQAASLDMQARIVFAQCIKMRARIVPINTVSLEMRARISARKSTTVENAFLVEGAQSTEVRMLFYAATGNVRNQTMSLRARIVRSYTTEMTSHLIVTNVQVNPGSFSFSGNVRMLQALSMQAKIVKP